MKFTSTHLRSLLARNTSTFSTLETTLAALASTQVELLRFLASGTVRAPPTNASPVTPLTVVSSTTTVRPSGLPIRGTAVVKRQFVSKP